MSSSGGGTPKFTHLLAGVALAACLPSTAATAADAPHATVYFNDPALKTAAGVKTLDTRLRRAIESVCGGSPRGGHLENLYSRRCREETLADVTPARDSAIRLAQTEGSVLVTQLEVKVVPFD